MPNQLPLGGPIILDRPQPRRPLLGYLTMLAALLSVGGAVWAWQSGYRPPFLAAQRSDMSLELVEVDQGDVIEYVVENGTLESATNTVVRCEVEALMGMVGGTAGAGGAGGSSRSGTSGSSGSGQGGSGTTGAQGGSNASGGSGAEAVPREGPPRRPSRRREPARRVRDHREEAARFLRWRRFLRRSGSRAAAFVGQFIDGVIRHQQRLGKAEHSQLQLHGRAAHAAAWLQHQEHDHDRSEKQPGSDEVVAAAARWWRRRWQRRSGWRRRPGRPGWRWRRRHG